MIYNYPTKELIIGDDYGIITFIDTFSKSEIKYKAIKGKIISIQKLEIFPELEHILFSTEESAEICKLIRKTKISMTKHHEAEIMKIFAVDPVMFEGRIIEDSKIISVGYDNKIKIWDYLSMECINEINGPEISKKNVEIRTVCYLKNSQLIAIGTQIGHIFFWDLNKSRYLDITYEGKYRHQGLVTHIIPFMRLEKNKIDKIECLLSCSNDGLIFYWEINKTELKEVKRKIKYDYEEEDEYILKEFDAKINKNKKKDPKKELEKLIKKEKRGELKIFKCTPGIKKCINSIKVSKTELKFRTLAIKENSTTFMSGVNKEDFIYLWDFEKENFVNKVKGTNENITCMVLDEKNNLLFSGGRDDIIDIWQLIFNGDNENISNLELKYTIKNSSSKYFIPQINDLIILPNINILVFSDDNKKIIFYDINKNEIIDEITEENETLCLFCLENYGKLLCGTKEKMIIEVNLNSELAKSGYKQVFNKYPFEKNKKNYEESEFDKHIKTNNIIKTLIQDEFEKFE
jgi:WD40 repeat protein